MADLGGRLPRPLRDREVTSRTSDGRLIGVLGFARDVTAQRRAAQTLREREELYHSIVSQAGDGIHLADAQTLRVLEVNEAACSE